MRTILFALLLVALLLVVPAGAKMSASVGETWIRWDYETDTLLNSTAEVYLNGRLEGTADEVLYWVEKTRWNPFFEDWDVYYVYSYHLPALNPGEEHRLEIRDGPEENATRGLELDSLRASTLPSKGLILFFLALIVLIGLAMPLLEDGIRTVLIGVFGMTVGMYTLTLAVGYWGLWAIVVAVIVFQGIWVIQSLYALFEEHLAWW